MPLRQGWATLAEALDVRAVIISERDTQRPDSGHYLAPNEIWNTWSPESFFQELAEVPNYPSARKGNSKRLQISELEGSAAKWLFPAWEPINGDFLGYPVPHFETYTIADLLTTPNSSPAVIFVYQPCPTACYGVLDAAGKNWKFPEKTGLLTNEIVSGTDSVGIFIMRKRGIPCIWYGSELSIHEARKFSHESNATEVQVAAGIYGALAWMMAESPKGIFTPEDLPYDFVLSKAKTFLGVMREYKFNLDPNQENTLRNALRIE